MEAQFEALSELVKNGQKLNFGQDFFVKFYQAFLYSDRWQQYIKGVGTTLLVTAIALVLGVVLGAIVAMVRVGYAQQKPHHRNPILGIFNAVAQVYVTVIPDKNYYLADKQYPILDYARLDEMIQAEIPSVQKINLYDKLHLEDYYRTDLHWKQEKITDVVDTLVQSMGQQTNTISDGWQIATEDFVGAYGAASAWKTTPDKMIYRTDPSIERMQVYDYERKQNVSVYAPEKIGGMDDYDFYLWGARALLTIQNPECHNGKKLLLFRDSFGSSIAPLLAEYYEEVTLVDLRYVSASHALELLGDTEYQDVLFLYSAPILNHGDSLRFG